MQDSNPIKFFRFHLEDFAISCQIQAKKYKQIARSAIGGPRSSYAVSVCLPEIEALISKQRADARSKLDDSWYWGDSSEHVHIGINLVIEIISSFQDPHRKTIDLDLTLAALFQQACTYSKSSFDEYGFITGTILEVFRGICDLQKKLTGHCQFESADVSTGEFICSPATRFLLNLNHQQRLAIYEIYSFLQNQQNGLNEAMERFKSRVNEAIAEGADNNSMTALPSGGEQILSYSEINQLQLPLDKDAIRRYFWLGEQMWRNRAKGWKKIFVLCAASNETCLETVLAQIALHFPFDVEYLERQR